MLREGGYALTASAWENERVTTMADLELGYARLSAVLGPCAHAGAVPVNIASGETVAWLCPGCDRQLPAGWDERVAR